MEIVISPVTNEEDELAMLKIRQQVFERELGIVVECLRGFSQKHIRHLLARTGPGREVVAVLSVVETSNDHQLHERYGLNFPPGVRVARYTQLAVAKPYRGLGIPLMLILEAHRLFVTGQFHYTWLLHKAESAAASSFCRLLDFAPSARLFQSEYDYSRVLLRNESSAHSTYAIRRAEKYLQQLLKIHS
jgi:GNAT superfamily N-acetyltransferase